MSYATSSAQPAQLDRYADVTGRIDHELAAEAGSLGACLRHFEATCRESGYTVNVSYLADALRAYAQAAEPVDRWVQAVGRGFERADQRTWSIWVLVARWLGWLRSYPRRNSVGLQAWLDELRNRRIVVNPDGPFSVQATRIIIITAAQRPNDAMSVVGSRVFFSSVGDALSQALVSTQNLIFVFRIAFLLSGILERLVGHKPASMLMAQLERPVLKVLHSSTTVPGSVLGVSDYAEIRFSEIDMTLKTIEEQIRALQDDIGQLSSQVPPHEENLAEVERLKKELQQRIDTLKADRDQFWNKLKPSKGGLAWGFDDGMTDAPWRTRSDDSEDQIAKLEIELALLSERESSLRGELARLTIMIEKAREQQTGLQHAQTGLQEKLKRGVSLDGPTLRRGNPPTLFGCTYYVAQFRRIDWGPPMGDAYKWNENAQLSGYDVGTTPVPGAILVIGKKSGIADWSSGHVAIVESVQLEQDGSYTLTVSEGNLIEGQPPGPGNIKEHRVQKITKAELPHISYIYDKRI